MIGRDAMRRAQADADELLGMALQILDEPVDECATPAQVARAHGLATSYVQLGGEAINRFEEAAHGA